MPGFNKRELIEDIKNYIKKGDVDLFSFDVFDTLITRATVYPENIFELMQNKLQTDDKYKNIPKYIRNNFYRIRKDAERYLNIHHGTTPRTPVISKENSKSEFIIQDIYNLIKRNHDLDENSIKSIIELECEVEFNNVLPLPRNIEAVKYLIKHNKRVVLISDMYLSSDFIRKLLVKYDDIFKDIPIYVSSEYNAKKCTAELFGKVRLAENADYKKWLHIGDDEISDIKVPKKQKIKTIQVKKAELTELEKRIFKIDRHNPYYQVCIGLSKYIRQIYHNNQVADLATIAVNILYPYARWIIDKALEQGIARLYFISRDGYIIKIFADDIIRQENLNIQTKYIYGSRKAWKFPCVDCKEDLHVIFIYNTVNTMAKASYMTVDEFKQFLPKSLRGCNKAMSHDLLVYVYNYLSRNDDFINYIKDKNKKQRELLIKYLNQEIDFKDDRFAFVDSTSSQQTQDLLGKLILKEKGIKATTFFYSCTRNYDSQYMNKYIFQHSFINILLELLTKAPHGQVKEYKEENSKIVPICFKETSSEYVEKYLRFVEIISNIYTRIMYENRLANDYSLAKNYQVMINRYPTRKVAKYLKKMSFEQLGATNIKEDTKLTAKILYEIYIAKNKSYDSDVLKIKLKGAHTHIRILEFILRIFFNGIFSEINKKIELTKKCLLQKF